VWQAGSVLEGQHLAQAVGAVGDVAHVVPARASVTWVKLDDHFADHPKVIGLSNAAFRAYVEGLCYSARHLTDGHIPAAQVARVATRKPLLELVSSGLWNWNDDGVVVHDYLEYQEDSATILERRRRDSERKKGGKS
jgi:hypothetical protein